ncbi:hypothetical protein [Pectobacterium carotovorum]|nr:hypothetical protein [Pectobacterium carotovorum]
MLRKMWVTVSEGKVREAVSMQGGARLECTTLDSRIGRGAFNDSGID